MDNHFISYPDDDKIVPQPFSTSVVGVPFTTISYKEEQHKILDVLLGYDDVLLRPGYSEVFSRSVIDLSTEITPKIQIDIPIISAPMNTVTGAKMAIRLGQLGGIGIIHRYQSIHDQEYEVLEVKKFFEDSDTEAPIGVAVGVTGDFERRVNILAPHVDIFVLDVAHGDHVFVLDAADWIKDQFPSAQIMAGNVATSDAVWRYGENGSIDSVRVGVGSGAHCTTRIEAGAGVPQISAILECVETARQFDMSVIADGGIRYAGDIVKALAAGADAVMCGAVLAGTSETPGDIIHVGYGESERKMKEYRGMASFNAKVSDGRPTNHIEGISKMVDYRGDVDNVINGLLDGIRSGLSYAGAQSILEFQDKAQLIRVSSNANHLSKMNL